MQQQPIVFCMYASKEGMCEGQRCMNKGSRSIRDTHATRVGPGLQAFASLNCITFSPFPPEKPAPLPAGTLTQLPLPVGPIFKTGSANKAPLQHIGEILQARKEKQRAVAFAADPHA